jgi:hypothetical protein
MITSFIEWLALREVHDSSEPVARKGRKYIPRSRWQQQEPQPLKPFHLQFVVAFRAKHPHEWEALDLWAERQAMTLDDLAERLLKERPGDVNWAYHEVLRLASMAGGGNSLR